jgi:nicotinamidase-related amidase
VLANVASVLGLPTLFSVVPEGDGKATLIPELRPYAKRSNTLLRTSISPFHHAPTVAALARSNRKTLVIAGYATEGAVEQAALDAIAAGYTVLHAVDAMGSFSQRGEDAALRTIEAAGSTPTSVLSLATRLVHDFITPQGGQIYKAIMPLLVG